jgi:hypothetical protein
MRLEDAVVLDEPPAVIYGHPKGGTSIMLTTPQAALDLPLRVLVREDVAGRALVFPAGLWPRRSIGLYSTSRCCAGGFAKLVAGNVENGEAPTPLWEGLEIRLDKNLDRLLAGINLDPNRRIAKINLVASPVLSSDDGVGHYRFALETAGR